jgi:hypothetical protein
MMIPFDDGGVRPALLRVLFNEFDQLRRRQFSVKGDLTQQTSPDFFPSVHWYDGESTIGVF